MLMSWTIFITTIADPAVTFKEICTLYGLRWRIENIFKTWKSNFNFAKVHNVSEHQLRVLLTARFIMIIIFYQKLYLPLSQEIRKTTTKQLSLMKFMRYIRQNIEILHELLDQRTWTTDSLEAVVRYCTQGLLNKPRRILNRFWHRRDRAVAPIAADCRCATLPDVKPSALASKC